MKRKWKIAAAAVCVLFLVTVAYAATAGSQSDPLVTLSYLNNVFTGKVGTMVDQAVTDRQTQIQEDLDKEIQEWDAKVKEAINDSGQGGSAVFSVVTLNKGQTLVGDVGCEIMLRVGTATCGAGGSATGLIDVTGGGTLGDGKALVTNHLYMVTISTRSVTATSATVKVLVRGPYTVS